MDDWCRLPCLAFSCHSFFSVNLWVPFPSSFTSRTFSAHFSLLFYSFFISLGGQCVRCTINGGFVEIYMTKDTFYCDTFLMLLFLDVFAYGSSMFQNCELRVAHFTWQRWRSQCFVSERAKHRTPASEVANMPCSQLYTSALQWTAMKAVSRKISDFTIITFSNPPRRTDGTAWDLLSLSSRLVLFGRSMSCPAKSDSGVVFFEFFILWKTANYHGTH